MKQFEVGRMYTMNSICNHECMWRFIVTNRTAQTVTLSDGKETIKCRISKKFSEYRNAETVFPLGQYSMAPMLTAN